MEAALQALAEMSPRRVLFIAWVLLLLGSLVGLVPYLEWASAGIGLASFVAYPYIVAGGLPAPWVRPRVRYWARLLPTFGVASLFVLTLLTPIAFSDESSGPPGPITSAVLMAVLACLLVVTFAPFFLATIAIRDAQRIKNRAFFVGSSVPLFLSLYFGLFGGLLYCHGDVQDLLDAS